MRSNPDSIQSVTRAFAILEAMAEAGGEAGVSELSVATGLPLPTIHRAMKTLVRLGYARQAPSRRYGLGARLLFLGDAAGRGLDAWARPHLLSLAQACGESANLAVLDGDQVVYVSQAPSRHSMRMFTEIGRRVPAHASAVGKAMLSQLPLADVEALISRTGLVRYTASTFTTWNALKNSLEIIKARGHAIDEGELEVGVRCVAVPIPHISRRMAVSISGPDSRVNQEFISEFVHDLKVTSKVLAEVFTEIRNSD